MNGSVILRNVEVDGPGAQGIGQFFQTFFQRRPVDFFVDGVGNFFGLATLFSGQNLRYSTFGQLQLYTLTIMVGIGVLLLWLFNRTL